MLFINSTGVENLDSGVGIYAPDAQSYKTFAALFDPIIDDYHKGFKPTDKHPKTDFGNIENFVNVDPKNEYVLSTRVRCGRSLNGYPFNPMLTEAVSFFFFFFLLTGYMFLKNSCSSMFSNTKKWKPK